MGHIRLKAPVRMSPAAGDRPLTLYWDTGASVTFIREDRARKLGPLFKLPAPVRFGGLGNGRFVCRYGALLQVRLRGVWCPHFAFVAGKNDLDDEVLVGHDFMQMYDIRLDPRRRRLLIDPARLRSALRIKSI